jgi:hypothetical protein
LARGKASLLKLNYDETARPHEGIGRAHSVLGDPQLRPAHHREHIQVYRARFGSGTKLAIEADIRRGASTN